MEVITKSGSNYKLYKYDELNILKSDSSAFENADFILLEKLHIDEKLNFVGTVYFNSLIELYERKYRIIFKRTHKEIITVDMNSVQSTTKIRNITLYNQDEFDKMIKTKFINIDKKYIKEYKLN
jgi:hypothetical protein